MLSQTIWTDHRSMHRSSAQMHRSFEQIVWTDAQIVWTDRLNRYLNSLNWSFEQIVWTDAQIVWTDRLHRSQINAKIVCPDVQIVWRRSFEQMHRSFEQIVWKDTLIVLLIVVEGNYEFLDQTFIVFLISLQQLKKAINRSEVFRSGAKANWRNIFDQ